MKNNSNRDALALHAIFESMRLLDKLRETKEDTLEREKQSEILKSYQICARGLIGIEICFN